MAKQLKKRDSLLKDGGMLKIFLLKNPPKMLEMLFSAVLN